MSLLSAAAALDLLASGLPLLDVRSEGEYLKGSLPGAVNIPILCDEERRQVGIHFREHGQAAAIALGEKLVPGDLRSERVRNWRDFFLSQPESALFCWRGGLRSEYAQAWLRQAGVDRPRLKEGYKGVRKALLERLEQAEEHFSAVVIGGLTGTGKTRLLRRFACGLDLEGFAGHRGSAFGARLTPQPSPASFENALAVALIRHQQLGHKTLLLEDESALIGSLRTPPALYRIMSKSPALLIEAPLEERIDAIYDEYIREDHAAALALQGDAGEALFTDRLRGALLRIRKRAGGLRFERFQRLLEGAIERHQRDADMGGYHDWIRALMVDYYDPMYAYQLRSKEERIIGRMSFSEAALYLSQRFPPA